MQPKTLLTTLLAGQAALAAIIPMERNAAAVNPVNGLDAPGSNLNPISGLPIPHGRKYKHKHHKFHPGSINPISGLPAPGARIHHREAEAEPEPAEGHKDGKHPQHQRHGKGKGRSKDPRIQPGINPINGLPAPGSPVYDRPHRGKGQGKNDKRPHNGDGKGKDDERPQNGQGKNDSGPQNGQDKHQQNGQGKNDNRPQNGQGNHRQGENRPAHGNRPHNGQGNQNRPANDDRPHNSGKGDHDGKRPHNHGQEAQSHPDRPHNNGKGGQDRPAKGNRPHNNGKGDKDGKRPHSNDNKPNRPHHNGPTRTQKPQPITITPLTTITVDGGVTSVPIRSKGAPNNGPPPPPLTEHAPPMTSPQLQPSDGPSRPAPPPGSDNSEGVIGKQNARRDVPEDAEDEKAEEMQMFDEGLDVTDDEDFNDEYPLYVDENENDEIFERGLEGEDADVDDELDAEFVKNHLADTLWWEEYRRSLDEDEDEDDFE